MLKSTQPMDKVPHGSDGPILSESHQIKIAVKVLDGVIVVVLFDIIYSIRLHRTLKHRQMTALTPDERKVVLAAIISSIKKRLAKSTVTYNHLQPRSPIAILPPGKQIERRNDATIKFFMITILFLRLYYFCSYFKCNQGNRQKNLEHGAGYEPKTCCQKKLEKQEPFDLKLIFPNT